MGIAMGLAAGALFGLSAIMVKIGMRRRPVDNGHFMSVLVNVLFLGTVMLWVTLPRWSWIGFVAFVIAGLMTTGIARGTSFMAIRLLGPARQAAVLVSAPLFAAITGWIFLGEGITLVQAAGGLIISIGLLVLLRSRIQHESPSGTEVVVPEEVVADVGSSGEARVSSRSTRLVTAIRDDRFTRGFVVALVSAIFFGAGFVVRKWGLSHLSSAVGGAFIGACTALSLILLRTAVRRTLSHLVNDNFREVPWLFVAGGVSSSLALFLQFSAFDHLPAWVVSLLQGTQAIWTLLWASIFLRDEERISRELVLSVAFVIVGVGIMTYGV